MPVLPTPSGPYPIGTVDTGRRDLFAGPDAGPRQLLVQLWYPARTVPGGPYAPYVEDPRTLERLASLMRLPRDAFAHLGSVSTHAVLEASVAGEGSTYPVVLFSHGRCGVREHNTVLVEELASHGYVVVTIDHPHAASGVRFPDGRFVEFDARLLPPWPRHAPNDPEAALLDGVVPYLADDVRFVIRRLATLDSDVDEPLHGRLDLDHVGMFGVSLGGVIAAEACVREPALTAVLSLDAYVPQDALDTGLEVPVMWISRDAATMRREGWDDYDVTTAHRSMRAAFEALPGAGYIVLVPGMYHIDFSDGRLLSPLIAERGISGPIDGARARDILRAYSLAFFDRHLSDRPAPLLQASATPMAGASFEARPTRPSAAARIGAS
jgi:dienelactone hydrolase